MQILILDFIHQDDDEYDDTKKKISFIFLLLLYSSSFQYEQSKKNHKCFINCHF